MKFKKKMIPGTLHNSLLRNVEFDSKETTNVFVDKMFADIFRAGIIPIGDACKRPWVNKLSQRNSCFCVSHMRTEFRASQLVLGVSKHIKAR